MSEQERKRARSVGYILTIIATFSLGTTEIFAPWYAGELHASQYIIGWTMGSFGIVYMFSPFIGGRISDRIGRKRSLIIATICYLAVLALYPLPFILPIHLIIIRALEGFFFGLFYPTIEAMVAELNPHNQKSVLARFSTSWSAGMILSPFIIAYMAMNFGNITSIYVVIIAEIVSLAIILTLVKNYTSEALSLNNTDDRETSPPQIDTAGLKTSPRFIGSYLALMLFGFVSTVLLGLFPTYIESLPMYTSQTFGELLLIWNLARTIGFVICTGIDQSWIDNVMKGGTIITGLSMLAIFFTQNYIYLFIAMITSGLGVGFLYLGGIYTIISATENEKGTHAGIVESLAGIGFFIGPILGGWLGDFQILLPYLMLSILSFAIFFLLLILMKEK